ncbi:unnamed protein product [Polarella glacialis]|uniref:Uncharacterized protein n=2 Tax=Polarella glacialis TaxID=89957 RepID=A0A813LZ04_POLGL|nr:unnamed protein product [Polarella glacialis]
MAAVRPSFGALRQPLASRDGSGSLSSQTLRLAQLLLKAAGTPVPLDLEDVPEELEEAQPRSAVLPCELGGNNNDNNNNNDKSNQVAWGSSPSSQVMWLAKQAERCPVPTCWQRLWDEKGEPTYIHAYGVFPPQRVHPMLGYFVGLVAIALAARRVDGELQNRASVQKEIEAFRQRVVTETAELTSAYTGPLRAELGADQWLCEPTGWYTDVDPELAPSHLQQVVDQLEVALLAPDLATPAPPRSASLFAPAVAPAPVSPSAPSHHREKRLLAPPTGGAPDWAPATPSTATPPSTGAHRLAFGRPSQGSTSPRSQSRGREEWRWYSPQASPEQPSPTVRRVCGETPEQGQRAVAAGDLSSCNYYDVASPARGRSPASSLKSRAAGASDCGSLDLEGAYGLDWTAAAVETSKCKYFAIDSPLASEERCTPRLAGEGPDLSEASAVKGKNSSSSSSSSGARRGPVASPKSPDLEAAYGCDWVDPTSSVLLPGSDESAFRIRLLPAPGPALASATESLPSAGPTDALLLVPLSPWVAAEGSPSPSGANFDSSPCMAEQVFLPQRLDFAACSPCNSAATVSPSPQREGERSEEVRRQLRSRVGVSHIRMLCGSAFGSCSERP